jgi:hypothetical protein
MVTLRATKKVLRYLPASSGTSESSTTALGDWYVNRLVIDRQPLLLLLSAKSLLTMVTPARDLRSLPARLADLVGDRLRRLGVAPALVAAELSAMNELSVAPTNDRRVLGYLTKFTIELPYHLPSGGWDVTTLPFVEVRLARTPCQLDHLVFPDREAPALLGAHWSPARGTSET